MKLVQIGCCFLFSIVWSAAVYAQSPVIRSGESTVTVPAGIQFNASKWKQLWWGRHWRAEWQTPVRFPYFDMDTTAGGLTPVRLGGGHQTKSLRLMSRDGKQYILRTIDKDLDLLIPEEFKGSFINDIVNDQVSTAHPYGPLAIAGLAESIGSIHTRPVFVYVPDDPRLGEFRTVFANKLCLFEERPSGEGWENSALTGYADAVVNSEKLFSKLDADHDHRVSQKEFLKIRLLDMVINDWDRHPDQWVWAAHKKNGKTTYMPFARDRDQAFSKTDGISIFMLSFPWILRSLRNMNAKIRDVIGVNLAAVSLDREFTNELSKDDWLAVVSRFQQALTDSQINRALRRMPEEIYNMSGEFLQKRLTQRRDQMKAVALKYYHIINRNVSIAGSNKEERFTINRIDKRTTEIIMMKAGKNHPANDTLFRRRFSHTDTKEINVYGLGDADQFTYTGLRKNRILVRTIGGEGKDRYEEQTTASGRGKKTRIYETGSEQIRFSNDYKVYSGNDTSYSIYSRKAFKYDWWKPLLDPGYNPDDGFTVSTGFTYRRQGWHKYPYAWQQTIYVDVAAATGALCMKYAGIFKQALGKWDFLFDVNLRGPQYVLNFYGLGNETGLKNEDIPFFRVRSSGVSFSPGVSRTLHKKTLNARLIYQSVKIIRTGSRFIDQPENIKDSSVFSTKYFGGAVFSFTAGNTSGKRIPRCGLVYHATAGYYLNLKETRRDYIQLKQELVLCLRLTRKLILAHRTGFAANLGDYEFYQANSIGGTDRIRGYWRARFTGNSAFYQNTELRAGLVDLKGYVLRGVLGGFVFIDDGRVWVKEEQSGRLHTGYGAGLYFVPYNKLAFSVSYGLSRESNVFTIKTGFLF